MKRLDTYTVILLCMLPGILINFAFFECAMIYDWDKFVSWGYSFALICATSILMPVCGHLYLDSDKKEKAE